MENCLVKKKEKFTYIISVFNNCGIVYDNVSKFLRSDL